MLYKFLFPQYFIITALSSYSDLCFSSSINLFWSSMIWFLDTIYYFLILSIIFIWVPTIMFLVLEEYWLALGFFSTAELSFIIVLVSDTNLAFNDSIYSSLATFLSKTSVFHFKSDWYTFQAHCHWSISSFFTFFETEPEITIWYLFGSSP